MTDNTPEGDGAGADGSPRKVRPSLVLAWLAVMAAAIAAGAFAAARLSRVRYSEDPRLDRAARAVVTVRPARSGNLSVQGKGGVFAVPVGLQFDRRRAVELAIELERIRRRFEAGAAGEGVSGAGTGKRPADRAADAYLTAEEEVGNFLAVDGDRAQLLLYALGWPWAGRGEGTLSAADFRSARSRPPAPLELMSAERRAQLIQDAERAPAWRAAEETLKRGSGLTPEQLGALRAVLCRQAVAEAFGSERMLKAAAAVLAKYADLVPAQAETVLAMAGATELAAAGADAVPALKAMAKRCPDLAEAILKATE